MEELTTQLPFHSIITGPTSSGKTLYLINQLRTCYRYMFEYIILVCPTYAKNKTYEGFANNDPRFIVISPEASDSDEINDLLEDISTVFSGYKTLIILDDCAFSKELKQRSNKFINLAFSGRHENISVWVLTQQLTAISKPFRENVGCIVSFFTPNKISNQTLFDEYGGELDPEQRKHFMKILKSEKYSRVCFCLRHPFNIYVEIPNTDLNK